MPKAVTQVAVTLDQMTLQTILMGLAALKLSAAAAEAAVNGAVAAQLRAHQEHSETIP